jgi:hypothetical protein
MAKISFKIGLISLCSIFHTSVLAAPVTVNCEFKSISYFSKNVCELTRSGVYWFDACPNNDEEDKTIFIVPERVMELEVDIEAGTAKVISWDVPDNSKIAFSGAIELVKSYSITESDKDFCSGGGSVSAICTVSEGKKYLFGDRKTFVGPTPWYFSHDFHGAWQGREQDIQAYNDWITPRIRMVFAVGTNAEGIVNNVVFYRFRSEDFLTGLGVQERYFNGNSTTGREKYVTYTTAGAVCEAGYA